jgi:hypothetical protein
VPDEIYYFKKGKFIECAESKNSDRLMRLWSILYLSDVSLSARLLEKFDNELGSDEYGVAWRKRSNLFKATLLLTNRQIDEFIRCIDSVKNIELLGEQDQFFLSLALHLKAIAKEALQTKKAENEEKISRFNLIGDSHVLINALHCGKNRGDRISFLPGITLRNLSSRTASSAQYALENALNISDTSSSIVFSLGEIDQREIYLRIEQYEIKNVWGGLSQSIYYGLRHIFEKRSCFQKFYIIGLPSFDSNVARLYDVAEVESVEERVNWYRDQFSATAKELGFRVLEPAGKINSADFKISDAFHFRLEYFKDILKLID